MYITKVRLANVRCFREFQIDFDTIGGSVLVAADNGDGKTTLLRSIAMGRCDESSAAALHRELPGEFVRKGQEQATIEVHLQDTPQAEAAVSRIL